MPGTQPSIFGIVSRFQPQPATDYIEREVRLGRYGEVYTMPMLRKQHLLADEGFYRVTNNAQTGITNQNATGWVATTPTLIIYNNDSPSNPAYKRIYLDYINFVTTTAGSAASGLVDVQAALYIDNTNRYTSGGTVLTSAIVNPNMDVASPSIASVYMGAMTVAAATGAVRALCGLRTIRPTVSGTVTGVVGETWQFNFGGVEAMLNGSITVANANNIPMPLPPCILGPNQCALLYVWYATGATNVAGAYAPEVGWWER